MISISKKDTDTSDSTKDPLPRRPKDFLDDSDEESNNSSDAQEIQFKHLTIQ